MDLNFKAQVLDMDDIRKEFWERFEPVSNAFKDTLMQNLTDMRYIIDNLIKLDLHKNRALFLNGINLLVSSLEWLNAQDIENIKENDDNLCLMDDEYEITLIRGVMRIHKSSHYIDVDGERVPYLAPDCFNKKPNVRYIE